MLLLFICRYCTLHYVYLFLFWRYTIIWCSCKKNFSLLFSVLKLHFFFLVLLHWLDPPAQWWIEVISSILISFLTLVVNVSKVALVSMMLATGWQLPFLMSSDGIFTTRTLLQCLCVPLLQLYLTLCNSMDHSPPGSSVHGILQAILEWVTMPFSKGSSQPRSQTCNSYVSGTAGDSLPLGHQGSPKLLQGKA